MLYLRYVSGDKSSTAIAKFFEKQEIPEEEAEMHRYTFLQKISKSGCIVKSTFIMEKIMDAKMLNLGNLYFCKYVIITTPISYTY